MTIDEKLRDLEHRLLDTLNDRATGLGLMDSTLETLMNIARIRQTNRYVEKE